MRHLRGLLVLTSACASAAPATEAPIAPTPPDEEAPAPLVTCTVVYASTIFSGGPIEARGEGATRSEACRAAALSVPEERRTNVERVDEVSPGWIVSPADGALPAGTPGAPPSACELEVAIDDGPSAEGSAEADTEGSAIDAAWAEACTILGETACAPPVFLATVTRRESSFHLADGVSTASHRVAVRLRRVRRRTAAASSDVSRAHACRDAYRDACDGGCAEATSRLVALDGVPLE